MGLPSAVVFSRRNTISDFASPVTIQLDVPLELPADYVEKHRFLSSQKREVQIYYQGRPLYTALVPRTVFNPYKGSAANKLIELILTGAIQVKEKRVVDLGCGSGIIGLACIYADCNSVLFTDINPNVKILGQHPLLRPVDRIKIQDMLACEPDQSYDVIIMSTPTNTVESESWLQPDTIERAIFRSEQFLGRLFAEAGRCLVKRGEMVLWVKISHDGILPYHRFILALNEMFDIDAMKIFAHAPESEVNVGRQPGRREFSDLVFSIRKRG